MKQILTIIILSLYNTSYSSEENACSQWQSLYSNILESHPEQMTEGFWKKEDLSNTDIVFFGEHHLHKLASFYKDTFTKIKQAYPSFDCLFLEEDYRSSIEKFKEQRPLFSFVFDLQNQGLKFFFVDQFEDMPGGYLSNELTKKLMEENPEEYERYMQKFINYVTQEGYHRNKRISQRIKDLFQNHQCTKAVAIYGSWHIDDQDQNSETLPPLLKKLGLTIKSYKAIEPLRYFAQENQYAPLTRDMVLKRSKQLAETCLKTNQEKIWEKTLFVKKVENLIWNGYFFTPDQ